MHRRTPNGRAKGEKSIWPTHLAVFYPYQEESAWKWILSGAAIAAMTVLAVRTVRSFCYTPNIGGTPLNLQVPARRLSRDSEGGATSRRGPSPLATGPHTTVPHPTSIRIPKFNPIQRDRDLDDSHRPRHRTSAKGKPPPATLSPGRVWGLDLSFPLP